MYFNIGMKEYNIIMMVFNLSLYVLTDIEKYFWVKNVRTLRSVHRETNT